MSACMTCGADPCVNPTFCEACREVDRYRAGREQPPADMPREWDRMPNNALWGLFNPERPTPRVTIEAIMYCVRERRLTALTEPVNIERLLRCDEAAKEQIDRRIAKLVAEGRLS